MNSYNLTADCSQILRTVCEKPRNLQHFSENLERLKNSFKHLLSSKNFKQAENLVKSLENSVNFLELLDEISEFYFLLSFSFKNENEIEKSLIFANKSLKYCKKLQSKSEKTCKCLLFLASILSKQGNHLSAKRKLQKSSNLLTDLIRIQDTFTLKTLFLVNLINLATEEETLGNLEVAYSGYIEAQLFMNIHFLQPDPKLSQKIISSINRIKNLMKNQVPRNNRDKKAQVVQELTDSEVIRLKPMGKSIRDTTVRTSEEPSPKLSISREFEKTEREHQKKKETFTGLQEINSQSFETPLSWRSPKSTMDNELKQGHFFDPYLSNRIETEPKVIEENPLKELKELDSKIQHKTEVKSLFNGMFKTNSVPMKLESENNEKVEVKENLTGVEKKKACIMTSKIDIDMTFYEIKYFFKSGVTLLEIVCSNKQNTYTIDMNIPSNMPIFDFITKKIEPCLIIKDEKIDFEESTEVVLANGMFVGEKGSGLVKIVRFYPRWKIQVMVNDKSQIFEMADIKNHFPVTVDFTKDLNSLISLFVLDSKGIQISLIMNYPLEKIYEGSVENEYLKTSLDVFISRVNYLNSFSYLLQVKESSIRPLLIENQVICKKTDRIKPTLNETINFLLKNINLDSQNQLHLIEKAETDKIVGNLSKKGFSVFQLKKTENQPKQQFNKSAMFSNLQGLHDGLNKALASPCQSPLPILQPLQTYSRESLLADMGQVLLKSTPAFEVDSDDRIILRTCLYRDNRIYQICMSLSQGKILNFYIRKGSEAENLNKFSIKVSTLCEKTGLRKDLLIPLGSYVLRNMLIIKESDICYFDFSRPISTPIHAIDKISSLFRALYTRRRVNLKLKNLAGKKKIKMDGLVYTCLVYIGNDALFIRLVRGVEVFSLDVCLSKVVKDGYFATIDKFFMSLVPLGFKIVEKQGKRVLAGLDKYRIV